MKRYDIKNNQVHAHITEWGISGKPIIIFVHGLGSTGLSVLELAEMLKDKYHIYAIDLPGHGRTPAFESEEEFEIPNLSNWLNHLIEEMTEEEFYLMAHSWGGDIALYYSNLYPQKVKKLVLLDGGYYDKKTLYEYSSKKDNMPFKSLEDECSYYVKDFEEYIFDSWQDFLEVEKNAYLNWSALKEQASRDLMVQENGKVRFRARGNTAIAALKGMYKNPTKEVYQKVTIPTRLLVCELPETWAEIRANLSNDMAKNKHIQVKEIYGTTHLLHWDKPKEVYKEIIDFLF